MLFFKYGKRETQAPFSRSLFIQLMIHQVSCNAIYNKTSTIIKYSGVLTYQLTSFTENYQLENS